MDFNGFKVRSFSADGARVVSDKISTSSESGSIRFIFSGRMVETIQG